MVVGELTWWIGSLWACYQIKINLLLFNLPCGWSFPYLLVCCIQQWHTWLLPVCDLSLFQEWAPACPVKVPLLSEEEICLVIEEVKYPVEQEGNYCKTTKPISANLNFRSLLRSLLSITPANIFGYATFLLLWAVLTSAVKVLRMSEWKFCQCVCCCCNS